MKLLHIHEIGSLDLADIMAAPSDKRMLSELGSADWKSGGTPATIAACTLLLWPVAVGSIILD